MARSCVLCCSNVVLDSETAAVANEIHGNTASVAILQIMRFLHSAIILALARPEIYFDFFVFSGWDSFGEMTMFHILDDLLVDFHNDKGITEALLKQGPVPGMPENSRSKCLLKYTRRLPGMIATSHWSGELGTIITTACYSLEGTISWFSGWSHELVQRAMVARARLGS
ncbi:hypothetical protein SELMODRAFT_428419 [Selaginella moellendorffii]|uniref:Uncharacterized protein n=1 Tax=Selaginella moellendorffii TaxID=88036 RepID=D8T2R7_SELML|nr:hypothetical protein SELMODRAFT_428419 [Selaginella moellendorffii]